MTKVIIILLIFISQVYPLQGSDLVTCTKTPLFSSYSFGDFNENEIQDLMGDRECPICTQHVETRKFIKDKIKSMRTRIEQEIKAEQKEAELVRAYLLQQDMLVNLLASVGSKIDN